MWLVYYCNVTANDNEMAIFFFLLLVKWKTCDNIFGDIFYYVACGVRNYCTVWGKKCYVWIFDYRSEKKLFFFNFGWDNFFENWLQSKPNPYKVLFAWNGLLKAFKVEGRI